MQRRTLLKTLAVAPAAAITRQVATHDPDGHGRGPALSPILTTEADWQSVAHALGRTGTLNSGTVYRVGFPRRDLAVTSYGIHVAAGLSLGSYAAFASYRDGKAMAMGDLVVTETELPAVTDALHAHEIDQTAIHKHLLAHDPDLWWTHFHAVGKAVNIAQGVRVALDYTTTPPPAPPTPPRPIDLDTAGIDAALGTVGKNDGGIYKFTFALIETIVVHGRVAPPSMGVTTALNFQPIGDQKAAINGDFAMTTDEVQDVIVALRAGGIQIVELHNHSLDDRPRLFYMHFWAVADGVSLAQTLAQAVHATRVRPA